MAELRERLLPRKPSSTSTSAAPVAAARESTTGRRPLFQGVDFSGLKKRGQSLRSWIRVDAATAASQVIEVDKFTMMRRCDLPARDLRLLDPLFVYPSTILGRERAIVVNLEQIRCIITADEVLLLNSLDSYVLQYVVELQRRLAAGSGDVLGGGEPSPDDLPFEFRALEVALEAACTFLDAQAAELEIEAYPLLDELTSKISTSNLERVRRLKSRLLALTRRVQKVRDEIEQLMDDDGDMAEMYLTDKKRQMEASFYGDQSFHGFNSTGGVSVSAPVSPVSSPPESRRLEKALSLARSRHDSMKSSSSTTESIEELEMLLEAYFVVIDSTLNKLTSLKEYIDDTEDFINIQLDDVRNQLIQFELLLTTATFVVAIFGVVAGIFGMNFEIALFDVPSAFQWVLVITGACGLVIFCLFLCYFKYRRLMPLMVAANMKAETISLMEMREAMEAEMNAIIESLCGAGGSRLSGNLVDSEVPMSLPKPQARHRSRRTPTGSPFFFYLGPTSTFRLFDRNAIGSVMSVSLSENTSQDSSTAEEAVSRIPFAIIDEIDGDSPAAEDGLQLSDEIVKSGNVEKCENLQSRLMAEAQSNQGNLIPLLPAFGANGAVEEGCTREQIDLRRSLAGSNISAHASIKAAEEAHEICCRRRGIVAIVPLRGDLWKPSVQVLTPYGATDIDGRSSSMQLL
ncbi:Magnesium transporter [Musa troglodytarum]|uniref:Magnesium transporter n=1 Tax=Musa troglodytarum TaxID=320322 RepID=A0A9E7HRB4_9LILI|nr:Magnesium transporter [Musa troglodytarum]